MEAPFATDEALLRRYREGDLPARDAVAERNMAMARWVAARYHDSNASREDLEQVAYVGLLKSIDRFESDLGSFQNYAISTIRGELRRHFRDHGWAMKVPRPVQESYVAVNEALRSLDAELGRSPTPRDVARRTGLSLERVAEAMDAAQAYALRSLDAPVGIDDPEARTLMDSVGADDEGYRTVEDMDQVGDAFRGLPEVQQEVVRMRFAEDLTQSQIADRLGVSQMSVSRWLRRALGSMSQDTAEA